MLLNLNSTLPDLNSMFSESNPLDSAPESTASGAVPVGFGLELEDSGLEAVLTGPAQRGTGVDLMPSKGAEPCVP